MATSDYLNNTELIFCCPSTHPCATCKKASEVTCYERPTLIGFPKHIEDHFFDCYAARLCCEIEDCCNLHSLTIYDEENNRYIEICSEHVWRFLTII